MAKDSKKKRAKMSVKKRPKVTEEKPEVAYDEEEEEEEVDGNITSEEEEEEDGGDERRRQKLLEAISSLGGQKRKHAVERSEAALQMSEFTVSTAGEAGDRIDLSELIGTLEQTPNVPNRTTKQLKNLQRLKTIESPLSKQQSEKIQRTLAFQKAATEVTRWSGIIKQNQQAEQMVFPLNQEPSGPKPMEQVVTCWKAQTPLEKEIFSLLTHNKQPINDPVLTPAEEASVRAMSLEEAKIRRAELQKNRALQSYYEARARRERRIKSKKFHKVQNKAKKKEFLRRFEEMTKTDPAAALEELNKMEVARMQERMSLRHQNSSKWARTKAIVAKYDQDARKAMQEQLEVHKELMQKRVAKDEEEEQQEEEVLPEFVNDAQQGGDPSNPWMRGKLSEDPTEEYKNDRVELTAQATQEEVQQEQSVEEEEEEEEEEVLLRAFERRRKMRQEEEEHRQGADNVQLEEVGLLLLEGADNGPADALLLDEAPPPIEAPPPTEVLPPVAPQVKKKRKRGIELRKVLTKETTEVQAPVPWTVEEDEDLEEEQDQRGLIREAFAGDDVISDFVKDKRRQEDSTKPKVVDLTLPGWGEWGGVGLQPSHSKRRRFKAKRPPQQPRKDHQLPAVIISEKRSAVSLHQVSLLPFPFENQEQFESTIRVPLGRTWNTERAVRKATKPRVVTQLGAIIQPMAREELLKDSKQQNATVETKRTLKTKA